MCSGGAKPDKDSILARLVEVVGTGEPEEVDIWPANNIVVLLFADMMSQWNVGMSGVVGMRYESLPLLLLINGIGADQKREVFYGLRVMERAAVEEINKS